jgi:hypothetical protein
MSVTWEDAGIILLAAALFGTVAFIYLIFLWWLTSFRWVAFVLLALSSIRIRWRDR